jgi:subtilase family serine protease
MHTNRIPRHRPHAARRWPWLTAAPLAACLTAACASTAATGGTAAPATTGPVNCAPPGAKGPPCYSPREYEVAYGVAPLLSRGINGSGETVVMPELAQTQSSHGGPTDIRKDLAKFDSKFGLPTARLHVITTVARSKTPYLANDEEVEDTEMVHAFAPGAALDIVLVPADATSSSTDFTAAATKLVRAGIALHAAVISISGSEGEHFFTRAEVAQVNAALEQAHDHHVTVVASSGDLGAISDDGPPVQVSLPASDPLVLGVGGTELGAAIPAGTYQGEMTWNGGTTAPPEATAACSPGRPTRTAWPGSAPPAASPTWPPTRTRTPRWRLSTATANSGRPRAQALPPRCGRA